MQTVDILCVALPIVVAALAGFGWGRWRGRLRSLWLLPVIPLVFGLLGGVAVLGWPIVGLWDALFEGLLVGAAFVWAGHRVFADWRATVVVLGTLALSLGGLELFARTGLPPGPVGSFGPQAHLFLSDALAQSPVAQDAVTTELVCSLAYGERYASRIDLSRDGGFERSWIAGVPRPEHFAADPKAKHRVLHIGDSMVYGVGVERDEAFPALLNRMEPGVQHINAGIQATAPDDYLMVARAWLRSGPPVNLAVMYILDVNDVQDMDLEHRCTGWQSLLTYDTGTAQLRFPDGPHVGSDDVKWLLMVSPPPYVFRVLARRSALAADACAPLGSPWLDDHRKVEDQRLHWAHLKLVVASAAREFKQRGTAFAVVYLPDRAVVERHEVRYLHIPESAATLAAEMGVPVLDPLPSMTEAAARGEHLFLGAFDFHFNQAGHRFMATWLHEQLAQVFPLAAGAAPQLSPSTSKSFNESNRASDSTLRK